MEEMSSMIVILIPIIILVAYYALKPTVPAVIVNPTPPNVNPTPPDNVIPELANPYSSESFRMFPNYSYPYYNSYSYPYSPYDLSGLGYYGNYRDRRNYGSRGYGYGGGGCHLK